MAASYSSATIFGPASVGITDSANALIAIRLPQEEICFSGNPISGQITNNMGLPLHSLTATNALLSSSSLAAGGTANFGFNAPSRSGTYTGTIEAQWTNGSAVIPYSVAVSIVDPGDLGINWDENAQKVTVVNKSHHTLWAHVGNELRVLESNRSTQFERAGDKTTVVFSTNGRVTALTPLKTLILPCQHLRKGTYRTCKSLLMPNCKAWSMNKSI